MSRMDYVNWQEASDDLSAIEEHVHRSSPAWRSAVISKTIPKDGQFVGYDRCGWAYYRDGKRLVAVRANSR